MEQVDYSAVREQIDPKFGDLLMMWTMEEFHQHERGTGWYVTFCVLGLGLIVWALLSANYIFAILLILMGTYMLMEHFRDPANVPVMVLTTGLVVGNHYHPWDEIKDFSIVYEPPEVRKLYLDFHPVKHLPVGLDFPEDMNPNELRETMLEFAREDLDRKEESFVDYMRRLYKL